MPVQSQDSRDTDQTGFNGFKSLNSLFLVSRLVLFRVRGLFLELAGLQ